MAQFNVFHINLECRNAKQGLKMVKKVGRFVPFSVVIVLGSKHVVASNFIKYVKNFKAEPQVFSIDRHQMVRQMF